MTTHAGWGGVMGALPSGRKAGQSLAAGLTPVSGMPLPLTVVLNAMADLPASCISSGLAVNLKYTPEYGETMVDNMVATIEGFFDPNGGRRDGGMEVQFNVMTRQTLLDAMKKPDDYPELLVRVSGYTAFFKDLSTEMQREILERTEFQLSTGMPNHHVELSS